MRENEFEKRMRQKMGDFGLSPSPEVWVEVERRIRKEKKRRFVFWWFLLLLGVAGGAAALLLNGNKKSSTQVVVQNNVPSNISQHEKTDSIIPVVPSNQDSKPEPVIDQPATIRSIPSTHQKNTIVPRTLPVKKTGQPNDPVATTNSIQPEIIVEPKEKKEAKVDTTAVLITNQPTESFVPVLNQSKEIVTATEKKPDTVSLVKLEEKKTDSTFDGKNEKKEVKTRKWVWGVSVSAGRSAILDGFQLFGALDYANLSMGGPQNLADYRGNGSRSSGSGSFGLFASKPISKKLDLRVGLDYNYLSAKMETGNRVDSARLISGIYAGAFQVNNFYRPGTSTTYTNRYHLLRLSGELSWKIIKGKKFSLGWDNGISYSRLLGSNMLHYSSSIPGYFKDKRLLTKDHFSFSTGFSFPLSSKISIQPYMGYTFTTVVDNSSAGRTNFFQYGIRGRLRLNKK